VAELQLKNNFGIFAFVTLTKIIIIIIIFICSEHNINKVQQRANNKT